MLGVFAVLAFFFAIGTAAKRGIFLLSAKRTTGKVEQVTGSNSRCGSKNNKYDCTEYSAAVTYSSPSGEHGKLSVGAGSARGHDQPATKASLAVGGPVPILYSKKDINYAYRDSFGDLWGLPLGSFVGSAFCAIGAFFRRGR